MPRVSSLSPRFWLVLAAAGGAASGGCGDEDAPKDTKPATDASRDPAQPAARSDAGNTALAEVDAAATGERQVEGDASLPDASAPLPIDPGQKDAGAVVPPGSDAGADTGVPPVADLAPWQLDCAHLPSDGTCQGGPREVLLVTTSSGHIEMFDPQDGHYLGIFKRDSATTTSRDDGYQHATQGPDQCIWTASAEDRSGSTRAVERWQTDGTFLDAIIPRSARLRDLRSLSFTKDRLFLTSAERVSTFTLDGKLDRDVVNQAALRFGLALGDGSLVTSGDVVQRWPADGGPPQRLLAAGTRQLWYGADSTIITPTFNSSLVYQVSPDTGVSSSVKGSSGGYWMAGAAQLGNGRWLYIGGEGNRVRSIDPKTGTPENATVLSQARADTIAEPGDYVYVGRACLPVEVVERQPELDPELPEASCDELPAGAAVLEEDFETGAFVGSGTNRQFHGWQDVTGEQPLDDIDTETVAEGARSLRVNAKPEANDDYRSGVRHVFETIQPKYIGFRMRHAAHDSWGYLLLRGPKAEFENIIVFNNGLGTSRSTLVVPTAQDAWIRVQMRDFDWQNLTYDLYVDCKRVGDDIRWSPEAGAGIDSIDLYVGPAYDSTSPVYFDEIVIK